MLNFIALPRSTVLVNIVILHFLQVTLLLMFQLVTFIILLNEIFLYSSAPLTSMAAPQPLAGGEDEMNSFLIRNNNNKNTHKAPSAFYFSFPFRGGGRSLGSPQCRPLTHAAWAGAGAVWPGGLREAASLCPHPISGPKSLCAQSGMRTEQRPESNAAGAIPLSSACSLLASAGAAQILAAFSAGC